jgi:hypothetical protein
MGTSASAVGQSVEEVYRVVSTAAVRHLPIAALYDGTRRLLCPHVLGYNRPGQASGECSAISTGEKQWGGPLPTSGTGIWRCLSLKKLSNVEWLDGPWRTEPHAPQHCVEHIQVDADDYPGGESQNGQ